MLSRRFIELLFQTHGGWENNDGAYGILQFNVQAAPPPPPPCPPTSRPSDGTRKALALPSGARQRPCRNPAETNRMPERTGPRPSDPQIKKRPQPEREPGPLPESEAHFPLLAFAC